jgi:DNA (cytosine-5)-methyltransferase 1
MQLVESFLPSVVLIENVPGFAKGRSSAAGHLERALRRVNKIHQTNYRLEWRIVNAVEYGVPQRRERVILLAFRDGQAFSWPRPTHTNRPTRAWDALSTVSPASIPKAAGRWADLLPSIPEGWNYLWHTDVGGGRRLFGYRTRYWSFLLKLAKQAPAWTLSAQPGPATGPFHWENRPLAIEELLKLQSFPANWNVFGPHREQVRQVGNATPPLLAEVIARAIGEETLDAFLRYLLPHLIHFRGMVDHPGFNWSTTSTGKVYPVTYFTSITFEKDPQKKKEILAKYREQVATSFGKAQK